MHHEEVITEAEGWLHTLTRVVPNRRTGSSGNRDACALFADTLEPLGYLVDTTPFSTLDYVRGDVSLICRNHTFELSISPYSLPCDVAAAMVVVSTVRELEACTCADRVLLMTGEICAEQLMPKNFVFYNPSHHKHILALLEEKRPAAIITATKKNPGLVGALDPFPLIVDGDFSIPCAFCTDAVGTQIASHLQEQFAMKISAERIPTISWNVLARKNPHAKSKVVITAHIDAYEDAPGACDNASGIIVLLLLAKSLADYDGPLGIEVVALNGEDHYSAAGQMDYLARYGNDLEQVVLAINIDDVGYIRGRSAYSSYQCSTGIKQRAAEVFAAFDGIVEGAPWPNGDHMLFVQQGVPALAVTSENLSELMSMITHTNKDTPDQVDCEKLVEVAQALERLIHRLPC
ncbi:M28 family peptidase [Candidatus Bipolaricaulota bacterium]|nr:M28 family peptidase [Candidatus Bipolaricaulota bacterium]